jgi:ABC-type dipeptide/oligopeptide/nickel transport system permease component
VFEIGAPIGIALGLIAAIKRNSFIDYFTSAISTLGLTVPVFVISMLLILLFSVWLEWLPAAGWGEPKKWILPITA